MQVEEQAPPLTSDDMTPYDLEAIFFTRHADETGPVNLKGKLLWFGPLARTEVYRYLGARNGK